MRPIPPVGAVDAVLMGYSDPEGAARVAATVGVWENNRFIGVVVIWPVVNPEIEPRVDMLKEVVSSISVS
ncbi:MAG: hypothetical protein NVS2B15_22030 [Pseudarthrobacter sp.]